MVYLEKLVQYVSFENIETISIPIKNMHIA